MYLICKYEHGKNIKVVILFSQKYFYKTFQQNYEVSDKYKQALLYYSLCQSLLASQFLSYFCLIPDLCKNYFIFMVVFPFVLHCGGNIHGWVSIDFLRSVAKERARANE